MKWNEPLWSENASMKGLFIGSFILCVIQVLAWFAMGWAANDPLAGAFYTTGELHNYDTPKQRDEHARFVAEITADSVRHLKILDALGIDGY